MSQMIITNADIVTPDGILRTGWLQCAAGEIVALGQGSPPAGDYYDAQGALLLPGFIDIHVHGAVGYDVMDASRDGLQAMANFFARQGVTGFLPTTLTASRDDITAALTTIREAMVSSTGGARILGAHLEGPYINPAKGGAQDRAHIRPIDRDELRGWLDIGSIRLVSLAPELDDSAWAIAECQQRHITVSAAHTAATYDRTQQAIDKGLSHATHTYNAMPPLHHREPGALAALMLAPTVRCEVIADNIHAHPAMLRFLVQMIGMERVILITDAMRAAGQPDGTYQLGGYSVHVDGERAVLADGTLAGSILTMGQAVVNFCRATGLDITDIWRATSFNAARAIGVSEQLGCIAPGYLADLVLWQPPQTVQATISRGQIIYERER